MGALDMTDWRQERGKGTTTVENNSPELALINSLRLRQTSAPCRLVSARPRLGKLATFEYGMARIGGIGGPLHAAHLEGQSHVHYGCFMMHGPP
jgi:hypothetical protein